MSHYRKVNVYNKEYEYVSSGDTFYVKGIGVAPLEKLSELMSLEYEEWGERVNWTPGDVVVFIKDHLKK